MLPQNFFFNILSLLDGEKERGRGLKGKGNHDTNVLVFWLQVFPTGQDDTLGPASFFSVHVEAEETRRRDLRSMY